MSKFRSPTDRLYEPYGPFGKVRMLLPCKHQRAYFKWQDSQPGAVTHRTCSACRRVYEIWFNHPETRHAQIRFLRFKARMPQMTRQPI